MVADAGRTLKVCDKSNVEQNLKACARQRFVLNRQEVRSSENVRHIKEHENEKENMVSLRGALNHLNGALFLPVSLHFIKIIPKAHMECWLILQKAWLYVQERRALKLKLKHL